MDTNEGNENIGKRFASVPYSHLLLWQKVLSAKLSNMKAHGKHSTTTRSELEAVTAEIKARTTSNQSEKKLRPLSAGEMYNLRAAVEEQKRDIDNEETSEVRAYLRRKLYK